MLPLVTQAWRSWKNAKSVALLAIVALAAGIGSTTAIYTVIYAVLLNPLPFPHSDRLVEVFGMNTAEPELRGALSNLDLADLQSRTRSFELFGWFKPTGFNLSSTGSPELLHGIEITPSLAYGLGVPPRIGRWFRDASAENGNIHLAVISTALWKRLGADPAIAGKPLTLDNQRFTVTGVMPPWFDFPPSDVTGMAGPGTDVWIPLNPQGPEKRRDVSPYIGCARLKPGVTITQAESDLKAAAATIAREDPADHPNFSGKVMSLIDSVVTEIRPTLLLLLAAAAALLLITCANVAGLLVTRAIARARETAVRVALGATRRQLALQYLSEGLLLSLVGAAFGVLLSYSLVRVVLSLAADDIPRANEIGVNVPVLLAALGLAIFCGMLFSLAPLWQASRTLPAEVLSEGVRSSAGGHSRRLSRVLVVAEIALSFTLLGAGALLFNHLAGLARVHPGFDPDHLLTFRLNAAETQYPDVQHLAPYQTRLLQAIDRIPGVTASAFVNQVPLNGCCYSTTLVADGGSAVHTGERVSFMPISPGYFRAMRIPLLQGRFFTPRDAEGDVVVIVDQAAARRYWPGRNPVGLYARISATSADRFRVVGVVGDVKNDRLDNATVPEVYFPSSKTPVYQMAWVVRSTLSPSALLDEVRRAIRGVNPAQPIFDIAQMDAIVKNSVARQRLQSFMVSGFAAVALLMAILGVYGVVSYAVRQRTVEIGTRMAVGATARDLLQLILRDGLQLAMWGILVGGIGVAASSLILRAQVFGLRIDDPRPFLFSTACVGALTLLACFFPAWRATLISPMVAIRNEPGAIWRNTREDLRRIASQLTGFGFRAEELSAESESELLSGIADAGRRSNSFPEAIESALVYLRDRIGAESVALFVQKEPGQPYRCSGVIPDACVDSWILPTDALLVSRLRHYAAALPIDASDLDAAQRWAAEFAPQHLPEIAVLREVSPVLCLRIAVKSEVSGVLFVGRSTGRASYNSADRRVLRGVSAQFAMMLENARLNDRIVEQERLRRELLMAAETQRRLFPDKLPNSDRLSMAGVCIPARGVGGDYYDFLDLGDRKIGIALADVAGKGIAAALVMSVVQASLRSLAGPGAASLGGLAARMNRLLHRSTGAASYATFFYAQLDEVTLQLRYVNAGHNPPYILRKRASGAIEELPAGGTIIGMFAQSTYDEAEVQLDPGDIFIAFTDGVPEAQNPAEDEYGEDRLKEALARYSSLGVEEIAARLTADLKSWIADAAQYDDLTFILVKVA